jgi:hypothetical protein
MAAIRLDRVWGSSAARLPTDVTDSSRAAMILIFWELLCGLCRCADGHHLLLYFVTLANRSIAFLIASPIE